MINFKIKDNQKDWFYIRKTVFEKEQGFIEEFDDIDKIAIHLTLYDNETLVGCTRTFEENHEWKIGRVALLPEYRGKGYGSILLKKTEDILKTKGVKQVSLHAQCRVQKFYEKCGYTSIGEILYEQGVAHIQMIKKL